MTVPKIMISIIVPYWNSEAWLGRCCESLARQKGDFEFILVSDHCTDYSDFTAIAYCQADERFMLVRNNHKRGVSGARNTGIDHAHGDYITFLDADDEMLEDAYNTYSHASGNITQFNHMRYYTKIDTMVMKYANDGGVYGVDNLPAHWFGVWNKVFKRDFLQGIRFDENLQYGEDGLFVLECLAKDPLLHHAERGLTAVKHRFDNQNSLSHIKTEADIIEQIHAYENFMLRQNDPTIRLAVCKEIATLWEVKMCDFQRKR